MTGGFLVALAVCVIALLVRVPSILGKDVTAAQRKSKLPHFWALFCLIVAIALTIPEVYTTVDVLMGGQNYANLITRFALFIAFALLGTMTATIFNSALVEWLVTGKPGMWVLGAAMAATVVSHFLGAFSHPSLYDSAAGWVYGFTWQAYLVYVAVCLLSFLLPKTLTPLGDPLVRWTTGILSLSMLLVVAYPALSVATILFDLPATPGAITAAVAILLAIVSGLLGWASKQIARIRRTRERQRSPIR